VELEIVGNPDEKNGILRWAPNPRGRKPVAYRVYASDEMGRNRRSGGLRKRPGKLG